jgi:hypothetical protein
MDDFEAWVEDIPLLIIDNAYTENYLKNLNNSRESIFKHLNMEYLCGPSLFLLIFFLEFL